MPLAILAAVGLSMPAWGAVATAATNDTVPPVAGVRPLAPVAPATSFSVAWTGSDQGGSGLASYDVQVSVDGEAYAGWLSATTGSSAIYRGSGGHGYGFRVRARDRAGNVGAYTTSNVWIASPSLAIGQFLRVNVDGLRVRRSPGLAATVLGYAATGTLSAIVGGPVSASGYTWYEVREPLTSWGPTAATTVGWVASGPGWLSPIHAPNTTRAPLIPTVRFTSPAAGTARSGPPAANLVSWTATNAATSRLTEEYATAASANLDCAGVTWRRAWTIAVLSSPLRIRSFLPGYCYRYTMTVRSATGQLATARSGTLWIYPAWHGGLNLYRIGVFATQQTWVWCVPAAVEMVLNVVKNRSVMSYAEQSEFYAYGRAHDYTDYVAPGLDPDGANALLTRAGENYGYLRAATVGAMEREAVTQMRRTGKPVILYVDRAVHAWVLSGFTATADPAVSSTDTITSFSVMGPLWPTQQYYKGYYDMPPNTRLSPASFAAAIGAPYHDTVPTPWEGTYVVTRPL